MTMATQVPEVAARQLARQMPDEQLVRWAEDVAKGIVAGMKLKRENPQVKSQIGRATEGALHSPAVILFTSWVRYQYGREEGSRLWRTTIPWQNGRHDVAHVLLQIVEEIRKQLAGSATEADARLIDRATMLAAARFLAFLRRAVVAQAGWGAAS